MPRRLSDETNELRIQDNISGSEIVLYYRMPTTEESIRYTNQMQQRRKNKLVLRLGEVRQKFGAAILTGFRDGDFEIKAGDQYAPIASDPTSRYFDPHWKEHVMQRAADIIEALAIHVFEASVEAAGDEADGEADGEAAGDEAGDEDVEKN